MFTYARQAVNTYYFFERKKREKRQTYLKMTLVLERIKSNMRQLQSADFWIHRILLQDYAKNE